MNGEKNMHYQNKLYRGEQTQVEFDVELPIKILNKLKNRRKK